jgi:hypothetical protein
VRVNTHFSAPHSTESLGYDGRVRVTVAAVVSVPSLRRDAQIDGYRLEGDGGHAPIVGVLGMSQRILSWLTTAVTASSWVITHRCFDRSSIAGRLPKSTGSPNGLTYLPPTTRRRARDGARPLVHPGERAGGLSADKRYSEQDVSDVPRGPVRLSTGRSCAEAEPKRVRCTGRVVRSPCRPRVRRATHMAH